MSFDRRALPSASEYYPGQEIYLTGRGKWQTGPCPFHGGSDSLRVNTATGAYVCMVGCGARGGDVLAFHQAHHGLGFVEAAKALGAWIYDDKDTHISTKPTAIPARQLLEVVAFETTVASLVASDLAAGRPVSEVDRHRLLTATGRIGPIARVANEGR